MLLQWLLILYCGAIYWSREWHRYIGVLSFDKAGRYNGMWLFDPFLPTLGPEFSPLEPRLSVQPKWGLWEPPWSLDPEFPSLHLIWVFKLCFKCGQGCLGWDPWQTNLHTHLEGLTSGLDPLWPSFPLIVNSWFRQSNGKVLVDHPLPTHQVKHVMYDAKSRSASVDKVVHPYRVNVHGYGRLGNWFRDDREI
jgi:hypothetical protein